MPEPTSQVLADQLEERLIDFAVRLSSFRQACQKLLLAITLLVRFYVQALHLLSAESLTNINEENGSLCKIFTASLKTSRTVKLAGNDK